MKQLSTFLFGVTVGMFMAQNYDMPDVKEAYYSGLETIKKYEQKKKK